MRWKGLWAVRCGTYARRLVARATIQRNGPCPCGSGRKHKLCCGRTRDEELADARRRELLLEIAALPTHFPLLRPDCPQFDEWADERARDGVGLDDLADESIEEGIARLGEAERRRIEEGVAEELPEAWGELCAELGDEALALATLLEGAVVAGLAERRPHDEPLLAFLEESEELLGDPLMALGLAVEPLDLWSAVEAARTAEAAEAAGDEWERAVDAEAAHLFSRRHHRRLDVLVERVRRELPVEGCPRASRVLLDACGRYGGEADFEASLAALLLGASLDELDELLGAEAAP